ncbi:MAG: hypothetical protein QME76_09945 [Bacillota bacterium]|nr:hypothetical protein [Bacillota bacterium]
MKRVIAGVALVCIVFAGGYWTGRAVVPPKERIVVEIPQKEPENLQSLLSETLPEIDRRITENYGQDVGDFGAWAEAMHQEFVNYHQIFRKMFPQDVIETDPLLREIDEAYMKLIDVTKLTYLGNGRYGTNKELKPQCTVIRNTLNDALNKLANPDLAAKYDR